MLRVKKSILLNVLTSSIHVEVNQDTCNGKVRITKDHNLDISTSAWSAQHPNAGRNIQQVSMKNMRLCRFIYHEFLTPLAQATVIT